MFGGTEGEISPSAFTALTAFGGAELKCPTLASQLLYLKSCTERSPTFWERLTGSDRNLVITLFGGTVLIAPTLVEEYASLSGVIRTGVLSQAECDQLMDRYLANSGEYTVCRTLTLFGACVTRHPSASKERKVLESATRAGTVSSRLRESLEQLVGAPPQAKARGLGNLAINPA